MLSRDAMRMTQPWYSIKWNSKCRFGRSVTLFLSIIFRNPDSSHHLFFPPQSSPSFSRQIRYLRSLSSIYSIIIINSSSSNKIQYTGSLLYNIYEYIIRNIWLVLRIVVSVEVGEYFFIMRNRIMASSRSILKDYTYKSKSLCRENKKESNFRHCCALMTVFQNRSVVLYCLEMFALL